MTPEEQRRARLARLAQAARDEMPYAAQSGLTSSLIAGAQPRNALADRRIYQPSLASIEAQNPDPRLGRPGFIDSLRDVAADPGRMLPGSGGWTEGMGAAAPHLAAATFDPAGAMLGGLAGRAAAPVVRGVAKQAPAMKNALGRLMNEEDGHLNLDPHFRPTGRARELLTGGVTKPAMVSDWATSRMNTFNAALRSGNQRVLDNAQANNEWYLSEIRKDLSTRTLPLNRDEIRELRELEELAEYMTRARIAHRPNITRQAPGVRGSNSNAPTIGGGQQPDPFTPTLSPRRPQ